MDKNKFKAAKNKILIGAALTASVASLSSCGDDYYKQKGKDVYGDKIEVMPSTKSNSLKVYDIKQSEKMLTAAYYGDFEGVKKAIENGADINAQKNDDGTTALMMLLPRISDVDMYKSSVSGKSVIPGLAKMEVINFLIDHEDIDFTLKDRAGCTVLDHSESLTVRGSFSKGTRRSRGDAVSLSIFKHIQERAEEQSKNNKTYNLVQEMRYER